MSQSPPNEADQLATQVFRITLASVVAFVVATLLYVIA